MTSMPSIRSRWFPAADEVPPAYAAKHRVADLLRAATERLVSADVEAVPPADLAAVEAAAEHLSALLDVMPDLRDRGSLSTAPLPDGALVERSPVSGRGNALAIPLQYTFDGEITRAVAVYSAAYEGPPGGVHGGYVAAAFDEILGVAQMVTGLAGFTGTLTVRYHRLTPIRQRIDFEAEAGERDGRKLTMHARAYAAGELLAEAQGLFIAQVAVDTDGNLWTRD